MSVHSARTSPIAEPIIFPPERLEEQRHRKAQDFAAKTNAVLADTKLAVTHAQSASDLDKILAELSAIAGPQVQPYALDADSQALLGQLNSAQQFVSAWQDYLSASSTSNTEQARNALERILNNTQNDSLGYFPRSKLLALRDGTSGATASTLSTESPTDREDDLLAKVKTVHDVDSVLDKTFAIPSQSTDLSGIRLLEQARFDAGAGLPVTLDVSAATTNNFYGDNISRTTALELLAILPYYFGTEKSDLPHEGETLNDYLDRLAASANTAGNLALLQRVIATKIAVTRDHPIIFGTQPAIFLAGLSQEAAGQYAPAVVSYEKSLQEFDALTPIKIVGDRLAAIKAAHPNEFAQGMTSFLTPQPLPTMDPRFPPGWPGQYPGFPRPYPYPPNLTSALPIPMTLSIPARASTNAAPAAATSPPASQ